jgi:ferredoxin
MATTSEVFDQDGEGLVVVRTPVPAPDQEERARKAAYLCPAGVIHITDDPSQG